MNTRGITLVLGGTGRRVAERLAARNVPVRIVPRAAASYFFFFQFGVA
jgi:hypothetical protein